MGSPLPDPVFKIAALNSYKERDLWYSGPNGTPTGSTENP